MTNTSKSRTNYLKSHWKMINKSSIDSNYNQRSKNSLSSNWKGNLLRINNNKNSKVSEIFNLRINRIKIQGNFYKIKKMIKKKDNKFLKVLENRWNQRHRNLKITYK